MSNLSPTRRDLLDRLSQTRGQTRVPLDTPVDKRAALALAQKGMVTLNVERTEVQITSEGRGQLRQDKQETSRRRRRSP